jgi:low affinity Fe/Cu permease
MGMSEGLANKLDTTSKSNIKTQSQLTVFFSHFANQTARLSGTPATFCLAMGIILVWGITGPLFKFSDTWQLVINTGTTIVTFLMVFLIQNTQNRDSAALHLKIDELIRATRGAQNALIDMENLTQDELDELKEQFLTLAHHDLGSSGNQLRDILSQAIERASHAKKQRHNSEPGAHPHVSRTEALSE